MLGNLFQTLKFNCYKKLILTQSIQEQIQKKQQNGKNGACSTPSVLKNFKAGQKGGRRSENNCLVKRAICPSHKLLKVKQGKESIDLCEIAENNNDNSTHCTLYKVKKCLQHIHTKLHITIKNPSTSLENKNDGCPRKKKRKKISMGFTSQSSQKVQNF